MRASLILVLLLGWLAPAGALADPEAAARELLAARALRGARTSVVVTDLETGEGVLDHNGSQLLVPASNQKLLIASAALAHWGPAHRFATPVLGEGEIDDEGVLAGTLWIRGVGDPGFTTETLWQLAEEIRLRGIRRIRDGIGVDVGYFDRLRFHPDWEPVSLRAYHAPSSAFAANYSSFRVEVVPARRSGLPAILGIAPLTDYFRTRSQAMTVDRAAQIDLGLAPLPDGSGESVVLRGGVAVGSEPVTYWRRVSFPELYAAQLLRTQLESQGVQVSGGVRVGVVPESARELLLFEGLPLGQLVWRMNKFSNNFIAEQLTKALGADIFGPPGTWEKGSRAMIEHLVSLGIDRREVIAADGSGLSARNRVSARALARVARESARHFEYGAEFLASLAVGGRDGTLEDRLDDGGPSVRGKTGHLRHVSSLSGLVSSAQGPRVFVVIVNGASGNVLDVDAAIDRFVEALGRDAGESRAQRAEAAM